MIIQLTQGAVAQIDEIDADLAQFNWCVFRTGRAKNQQLYSMRWLPGAESGLGAFAYMHRIILARMIGRQLQPNEFVDHINHNGLDNQRANLRLATKQQNCRNARKHSGPLTSRFKGVCWDKSKHKWLATISINSKHVRFKRFESELAAALAYDSWAREFFGDFAHVNFPQNINR